MKKKNVISVLLIVLAVVLIVGLIIYFCFFRNKENLKDYSQWQNIIQSEWDKSKPDKSTSFLNTFNDVSNFVVNGIEETEDDYYTVNVSVTSPDISDSLVEYQNSIGEKETSKDELDKAITDLINSAEDKTTEQTVYVIKDTDGEYHVRFTEEFVDAMFGYAYSNAINTLNNESALNMAEE